MPKDQTYLEAEKKIANKHPRIKPSTNARTRAIIIRAFVAHSWMVFTPKGGHHAP